MILDMFRSDFRMLFFHGNAWLSLLAARLRRREVLDIDRLNEVIALLALNFLLVNILVFIIVGVS
jgi:hypothetical protein